MIGKENKVRIWVPHALSKKNKDDHISIETSLLSRQRNYLFLKNIIAGDERSVFHDNVQGKTLSIDKDEFLQPSLKVELHERKGMQCVCWDYCGIILFKFSNHRQIVSAEL